MNYKYLILILSSLLIQTILSDNNYELFLHPHTRGAYCLDGSPAGMYIHKGSEENKNKFLIYL